MNIKQFNDLTNYEDGILLLNPQVLLLLLVILIAGIISRCGTIYSAQGSPTIPIDEHQPAQSLVIMQNLVGGTETYELTLSSYLGGGPGQIGSGQDTIRDIDTDAQGNIYVTGGTSSPDFPTTPGAYDTTLETGCTSCGSRGPMDIFVTKINPSGQIIWSTFIGGPNYDRPYAIEVDKQGYVYLAGRAGDGFPVTSGVFQDQFMGGFSTAYGSQDGFVLKLTPDGSNLVYASYIGSDVQDIVRDLDIDNLGNAYVVQGHDGQPGIYPPTVDITFTNSPLGGSDVVAAKINPDGSQVLWARYLGGSGEEGGGPSIRVNDNGNTYAVFTTKSDGIATAGVFQMARAGVQDMFLAKLNTDGNGLVFGSYLGGTQDEWTGTHNLALDTMGNAYIHGATYSSDFPTTQGAYQTNYGGSNNGPWEEVGDQFVSKISSDGSQLLASTFIGGNFTEGGEGTAVDSSGNVYATGFTYSDDYPVTYNAFDENYHGSSDAILFKLSSDLSQLLYSTYMGTSGSEGHRATAVDSNGNFLVGGRTDSANWPTHNPFQDTYAGGPSDAVVARFSLIDFPPANNIYIPIVNNISKIAK